MRIVLDSNVLISLAADGHPKHAQTAAWYDAHRKERMFIAMNTVGETFAGLIKLPVTPRIDHRRARVMVRALLKEIEEVIPISRQDYLKAVDIVAGIPPDPTRKAIRGNLVFDVLVGLAAQKRRIRAIVTNDVEDVERFWPRERLVTTYDYA